MAEPPRRTATYGPGVPLTRAGRFDSWRTRRRMERHQREVAAAVRQKPFRFYGLPSSWEGRRALAGSSYGRQGGLRGVRLAHRIGSESNPVTVYVTTQRLERSTTRGLKEETEFQLGLRGDDDQLVEELEWMRMHIPVDGILTNFEVIAGRDRQWGAVGAVGEVAVGVEVSNFAMADVVLATITDVEPYLAARQPPGPR